MTTNEIAAAERVFREYVANGYQSRPGEAGEVMNAALQLADAYLSLIAERDETPVDESWLRTLFGDGRDPTHNQPWRQWIYPFGVNGNELIVRCTGKSCWSIISGRNEESLSLVSITTRVQLLRLLESLNITVS